jgi:hypothetical protein
MRIQQRLDQLVDDLEGEWETLPPNTDHVGMDVYGITDVSLEDQQIHEEAHRIQLEVENDSTYYIKAFKGRQTSVRFDKTDVLAHKERAYLDAALDVIKVVARRT